ncbi:MAG: hypothetical protein HC804_00825, partial [Anaerolineae bacterium]|nr:hypothetical protein [Anaerolineae bacterium]
MRPNHQLPLTDYRPNSLPCIKEALYVSIKSIYLTWLAGFSPHHRLHFSGIAVLIFAFLTVQVIMRRPVNPLDNGGVQIASVNLNYDQSAPPVVPTMPIGQPTPTLVPTNEPWQGSERVNILLLGIDRRPGEAFISRTDTIMIISI